MRSGIAVCIGICVATLSHATDSFNSEASHFLGGVAMGGGATYAVDHFWPQYSENRVLIGFAVATAGGVVGEIYDSRWGHPKKFSVLDAASTSLGGAVGAMATDKWILTPVAKSVNGTRYYGLASQYHF
jgi:hypothetical protein